MDGHSALDRCTTHRKMMMRQPQGAGMSRAANDRAHLAHPAAVNTDSNIAGCQQRASRQRLHLAEDARLVDVVEEAIPGREEEKLRAQRAAEAARTEGV